MRVLLAFLVIVAVPALAQKQPWEWTDEERIAARTDLTRMRQRIETISPNRAVLDSGPSDTRQPEPRDAIRGLQEPELFLPTEILTMFVTSAYVVDDEASEGFRLDAKARVAEIGLPDDFLTMFEREAVPFIHAQRRDYHLRMAMSEGSVDPREAMARLKLLEKTELCPLRFALVERMRELYSAKFDQFLYGGVVRGMSRTYFGEPPSADELRRQARGCR